MSIIEIKPIGVINTSFKNQTNIPIQGRFGNNDEGCCTIYEEFSPGLEGLDGFSHAILIYYFHKALNESVIARPFLEDKKHGIFAIRSPNRPNRIGLSIVKVTQITDNRLYFTEVDMLDGSPLLDIKPYVKYFDNREKVKSGWIDKHFEGGNIPLNTIIKK